MSSIMDIDFTEVKLCGRTKEFAQLKNALERASDRSNSTSEVVFIEGDSGTGKSALIEAFRQSLAGKQCLFCSGKFDQEGELAEPFSAITDCLSVLHENLQELDPEAEAEFRKELGLEARVLSKIIPSTRDLFASDDISTTSEKSRQRFAGSVRSTNGRSHGHSLTSSGPSFRLGDDDFKGHQSFERLQVAIRSVMRAVSTHYPVIFVIEDLHWADEGSVRLLKTLISDKHAERFMFVGVHQMVGPDHVAIASLKVEVRPEDLTTIHLGALSVDDISDIASSLLRREEDELKPLAEVIHRKTGGNAFFAVQFLRLLCDKALVSYSIHTYRWEWDLERIVAETQVADNVLDLLSGKIRSLPKELQFALTTAACLGSSRFDAKTLLHTMKSYEVEDDDENLTFVKQESPLKIDRHGRRISSVDVERLVELETLLAIAVKEGLLERLGSHKYKFSHDRIKDSAYALLLDGGNKLRLHSHIGRQLLRLNATRTVAGIQFSAPLFLLAVHHMNVGSELIVKSDEKVELARLNDQAAEISFGMSSFLPAADLLITGLSLLDPDTRWDKHYDLTLSLTSMLAHLHFCCGKHEASRCMIDEVLNHARSLDDKLGVYRSLILSLWQNEEQNATLDVTLSVLEQLGIYIPRKFRWLHIARGLFQTRRKLRSYTDEELLAIPEITEKNAIAAWTFITLLIEIALATGNIEYHILALLQALSMMLTRGHYKGTGLTLAFVGFLFHAFADFDSAYHYVKLALKIAARGNDVSEDAKTIITSYWFVVHWKKPFQDCIEPVLGALKMAMDVGDVKNTFYAIMTYSELYLHCGLSLDPIKQDMMRFVEVLEGYGQGYFLTLYLPRVQLVLNLMGKSENPMVLTGEVMDQEECLATWTESENKGALQGLFFCRMLLAYYFDDLQLAEEMSAKQLSPIELGFGPWLPPRTMFQGLIAFALFKATGRRKYKRQGCSFLRKLQAFFAGGNVNCHHMVALLRAEQVSICCCKDPVVVQREYDEAIKCAGKLGFKHNQALGNERAGVYFLEHNDEEWASTYLTRAWEIYARWGARAKVRQMEEKYGDLLLNPRASGLRASVSLKGRPRLQDVSVKRGGPASIFNMNFR
jgi:predicted ATPase